MKKNNIVKQDYFNQIKARQAELQASARLSSTVTQSALPQTATEEKKELLNVINHLKKEKETLKKQQTLIDHWIEFKTGIQNFNTKFTKTHQHLSCFFAKRKLNKTKKEQLKSLADQAPELFKQWAQNQEFTKIEALAKALRLQHYHEARRLIKGNEIEFQRGDKKFKY